MNLNERQRTHITAIKDPTNTPIDVSHRGPLQAAGGGEAEMGWSARSMFAHVGSYGELSILSCAIAP